MEDKYLVKAKRTDNREWVQGYIVKYGYTGREKYYIVPEYASDLYSFLIDPNTICRCTGLKDENGKQIWENDILHNGNYFVVKWNEPCARFDIVLNNSCNIPIGKWEPMICDWKTNDFKEYRKAVDYEIIGNIFDNPELLNRDTIRTYCKDGNDYER
jgi:uncharacterized phage protein (TIGR01671 family)